MVRVRSESFRWHGRGSIHGTSVGAAPWLKRPLTSEQEFASSPGRRGIGPNPAPLATVSARGYDVNMSAVPRRGGDGSPARRRTRRPAAGSRGKQWSQHVTRTSRALDLEAALFALGRPTAAAGSLKRSLLPQGAAEGSRISIRDVHAQRRHQPCRQGIERFPDAVARGVPRASGARRSGASDTSTPARPGRSP
jgi:hypothetical protein